MGVLLVDARALDQQDAGQLLAKLWWSDEPPWGVTAFSEGCGSPFQGFSAIGRAGVSRVCFYPTKGATCRPSSASPHAARRHRPQR